MSRKSKDFGAVKNEITGKTIREMKWDEMLGLSTTERLSTEEAMRRIREVRAAAKAKQ
jgi:hypothetical protein